KVYVNGQPEKLKVLLDDLNQSFKTTQPLRIGAGGGPENRFHGGIGDVRVYNAAVPAEDVGLIALTDSIGDIAAVSPDKRTPQQTAKMRRYFLQKHAPEPIRQARQEFLGLRQQREQLIESLPTTMV